MDEYERTISGQGEIQRLRDHIVQLTAENLRLRLQSAPESPTPPVNLQSVQVLRVGPGDALLWQDDRASDPAQMQQASQWFNENFPGVQILCTGTAVVSVVRRVDRDQPAGVTEEAVAEEVPTGPRWYTTERHDRAHLLLPGTVNALCGELLLRYRQEPPRGDQEMCQACRQQRDRLVSDDTES